MNTQEQAYINGFVKRASGHGLDAEQAVELLKEAAPAIPAKLLKGYLGALRTQGLRTGTIHGATAGAGLGGVVGGIDGLMDDSDGAGLGTRLMRGVAGAGKGIAVGGVAGGALGNAGARLTAQNRATNLPESLKKVLSKKSPTFNGGPVGPERLNASRRALGLADNATGLADHEELGTHIGDFVHKHRAQEAQLGQMGLVDQLKTHVTNAFA